MIFQDLTLVGGKEPGGMAVKNSRTGESAVKKCFDIKNGALVPCESFSASVVVYAAPDETEKQQVMEALQITRHDLDSALDPDEISRLECTPEHTTIIWKRPDNVSFEQRLKFEVSSTGLFLQPHRLTIILADEALPFSNYEFTQLLSLNDLLLKFFLQTIHHFIGHLKGIKLLTSQLQTKLNASTENRYFLQMFDLSESLIYYLNALEANAAVLAKLRSNSGKVAFSQAELELIDDVTIEHQQCSRQTQIYSSVLSGLMDARGTIINNNMNVLLKNLTTINVVFLPLNLIAGIFGMSEFSAMTHGMDWRLSYPLFFLGITLLGWLTWLVLRLSPGRLFWSPKRKK